MTVDPSKTNNTLISHISEVKFKVKFYASPKDEILLYNYGQETY